MRPDLRRRGGVPALSLLTACGVAVLAGCSSQPASPAQFSGGGGSQAGNAAVAVTVECPKVADALPDVQVSRSVRRAVARNLGVLEIQVADANRRLAQTAGAQDATTAQQAVLSTLANQRAVTIGRIATALEGAAQRPENLGALANCTLGTGGGVAPPIVDPTAAPTIDATAVPTVDPSATALPPGDANGNAPIDSAPIDPTAAPTGDANATGAPAAPGLPTDGAVEVQAASAGMAPAAAPTVTVTVTATPTGTPTATATATADPSANATATATPAATGTATPPATSRLLACPSVADQITIPRGVRSDVALELGLMELDASAANERLTAGNADQDAVLRNLEQRRAAGLARIARILSRGGGQAAVDLGTLATCQAGLGDNNGNAGGAPVPSATPTDTATATPTGSATPAGTATPGDGGSGGTGDANDDGVFFEDSVLGS